MGFWYFLLVISLGEVISSVSELQSLKVEPSAEKEKQRSEAKHILLRKQRALADLFQHLAKTGEILIWNLMKDDHQLLGRKTMWVMLGKFLEVIVVEEGGGRQGFEMPFWEFSHTYDIPVMNWPFVVPIYFHSFVMWVLRNLCFIFITICCMVPTLPI